MAEKKIGGKTYRVAPVLAFESIKLKAKLMKVLGGGISKLPKILANSGKDKTEEHSQAANAAAMEAFTEVFVNGDPDQMANLIKEVAEIAEIQSESGVYNQVDIDRDFTGNEQGLFELCFFVLKEVFSGFLPESLLNGFQKISQKD